MKKWEQQLRSELAGPSVWQHPRAEAVLQWFQANQRALSKKPPQSRQFLEAAVRERIIESERSYRALKWTARTRRAVATRRLRKDLKAIWEACSGQE